MPFRDDTSLPWNLAGCVAYYQPVAGPDALSVRYNQAHGGDNRYRAEPGVLPGWNPLQGWVFNGSTHWLNSGIYQLATNWSFVVRFSGITTTGTERLFGVNAGVYITAVSPNYVAGGGVRYNNSSVSTVTGTGGVRTQGVVVMSDRTGYIDAVVDTTTINLGGIPTYAMYIGCINNSGSPFGRIAGNIQAFAAYARPLSATEVWHVTRQMQYCHVNPDWSVWGQRRRYYHAAPGPSFLAAWAAHSNCVIKQVGQ